MLSPATLFFSNIILTILGLLNFHICLRTGLEVSIEKLLVFGWNCTTSLGCFGEKCHLNNNELFDRSCVFLVQFIPRHSIIFVVIVNSITEFVSQGQGVDAQTLTYLPIDLPGCLAFFCKTPLGPTPGEDVKVVAQTRAGQRQRAPAQSHHRDGWLPQP